MKTKDPVKPAEPQSVIAPAVAKLASRPVWAVLMIASASFVIYGYSLWYPLARDQAIFAYIADRMREGFLPYKDAWDFKSPGIFYMYQLAFTLFGRSMMAIRSLDMLCAVGTSILLWHIFYRKGHGAIGVVTGILYGALYGTTDYWTMAQTEGFAVFFTAIAANLLLSSKWNSFSRLVPVGLALGAAFLIKLPFAMVGLSFFIWAVYSADKSRRLKTALILVVSAAALPALTAVYFASHGILDDALAAGIWFAGKYRSYPPKSVSDAVFDYVAAALGRGAAYDVLILPLYICGFLYVAGNLKTEQFLGRIWLVAALATVAVQLKSFFYHWVAILPVAAMLGGLALCAASSSKTSDGKMSKTLVSLLVVILLLRAMAEGAMYWGFLLTPARPNAMSPWLMQFSSDPGQGVSYASDMVVANYVTEHTSPGDTVLVIGFEPLINFLSERPSPTRFVYMDAVTAPWTPPAWREEYLQDVEANLPAVIVVATNDPHVWRAVDSATMLQEWPELKSFVEENYNPDVRVSGFHILRLKDN